MKTIKIAALFFFTLALSTSFLIAEEAAPLPELKFKRGEKIKLFNGKDFTGWNGDMKWFRIEDGAIVAGILEAEKIPHNYFLATDKMYHDFELTFMVKTKTPKTYMNGGVQVRSVRKANSTEMIGYQADIGMKYWGAIYDESRRRKFLTPLVPEARLKTLIKPHWNDYRIVCLGNRIQIFINGEKTCDYVETEEKMAEAKGHIGLQVHKAKHGIELYYKAIVLHEISKP